MGGQGWEIGSSAVCLVMAVAVVAGGAREGEGARGAAERMQRAVTVPRESFCRAERRRWGRVMSSESCRLWRTSSASRESEWIGSRRTGLGEKERGSARRALSRRGGGRAATLVCGRAAMAGSGSDWRLGIRLTTGTHGPAK